MTLADINDLNIEQRTNDFQNMLKSEHVYIVPLCYFCDVGKINFPLKTDFKFKSHLEKESVISAPDVKIIFKITCLQYEQLLLDKNFRQYLKIIMVS